MRCLQRNKRSIYLCNQYEENGIRLFTKPKLIKINYQSTNSDSDLIAIGMEYPMDARSKYAKAINDYLGLKDKAISKKIEIAKILTDIYRHNGDVQGALEGSETMKDMSFNFDDIKKIVDDSLQEKTKKIELNKK